ncbi:MAG: DUF1499 domain-containing protein [Burkholderiales bacterium]|nr:DUF1499 domain-containing protein [Burkholderiales bacterium]
MKQSEGQRPPGLGALVQTHFTRLALAAGVLAGLAALLAGPAYRLGLLGLGGGLQTVRWAATVAFVAAVMAALALLLALAARRRAGWALLAALVLNLAVAGPPIALLWQARHLPLIHDISTDTEHPPAFVAVLALRKNARNPVDWVPATGAAQRLAYPDIRPLHLDLAPAAALARARTVALAMGWDLVDVSEPDLRLEATATTLLFGFKDDVVVRVTPQPSGCIVDIRSLSRVGSSDLGTNARRVRNFLQRMSAG